MMTSINQSMDELKTDLRERLKVLERAYVEARKEGDVQRKEFANEYC